MLFIVIWWCIYKYIKILLNIHTHLEYPAGRHKHTHTYHIVDL